MASTFTAGLSTSGIGSLPYTDPVQAVAFVNECGLDIPFWPQLPKRTFLEQMVPQYAEGMPGVIVDSDSQSIRFDEGAKYDELAGFYSRYLEGGSEGFVMSRDHAAGFHAFLDAARGRSWAAVKGQVVGPITFANGILNNRKDALYADPDLRDAAVKLLARKAQWQVGLLKSVAGQVIMFVDEPVLAALGSSAYLGISDEDVITQEKEIFDAIRESGGLSGLHVCGNSDWGVLIRTTVDVLNFDAYQYGPRLALYARDVREFLEGGGTIAWGMVPTTAEDLRRETCASLVTRFRAGVDALTAKGIPESLILEHSLLTPCCGCGSLNGDDCRDVFVLLSELRDSLCGA